MTLTHAISQAVSSHASAAPPVVLVFGLHDGVGRWFTRQLRDATPAATGVFMPADLPPAAVHSICEAADAGVHLVSAKRGMDGTFLEYWQMLAEAGKARLVAVHDLEPVSLDVNEAAAIATRVLEEDILPYTLPLLDDDERVVGVLDAVTGEQWFPDGPTQAAREDFTDAVEVERNQVLDEADTVGLTAIEAVRSGMLCPAVTVDTRSRAGVNWLARALPARSIPAVSTVLPGDDTGSVLLAAGADGLAPGRALAVSGTDTEQVAIESLIEVTGAGLLSRLEPGRVAAALATPRPRLGSLLVGE